MKNTTFVRAGAGSGKTHRLTQDIVKFIKSGVRADEIILTTFTNAAAAELREKVRAALYEAQLYEDAVRLDSAAIGTIHSIALQFVSRYWYLLGISANVHLIDEDVQKFYISQSLATLTTSAHLTTFRNFENATKTEKDRKVKAWEDDLRGIIAKMSELGLSEQDLDRCQQKSLEIIREMFRPCDVYYITNDDIDSLLDNIKVLSNYKLAKDVKKAIDEHSPAIAKWGGEIGNIPLYNLYKLSLAIAGISTLAVKKEHPEIIASAANLATRILSSPNLYNIIKEYITTIIELAKSWKKRYEEFKTERCLLDYCDVQDKFDELLKNADVVNEIKERYKVALVDEFQDCSPIQVSFFERLSELMRQSVWVGDIKQAIYNFRGTNTAKIRSIIDQVEKREDGNLLDHLECCWRSNNTIRQQVNRVFSKVFSNTLTEKDICLDEPQRKDPTKTPTERNLRHWHIAAPKQAEIMPALVKQVKMLHDDEGFEYRDIAILFKNRDSLLYDTSFAECAKQMSAVGIPINAKITDGSSKSLASDNVANLLTAIISVAAMPNDELSKAIIVHLVEEGYTTEKLLSERVQSLDEESANGKKWLAESPIITKLNALCSTLQHQSVSSAVETLIVEMDVPDLIKRISPDVPIYNYCAALYQVAKSYEDQCITMGRNSSLLGLASLLKKQPISNPQDDNGVNITTYHSSKGLEWKCVILYDLTNDDINKYNKVLLGVKTLNSNDGAEMTLIPNALEGLMKNVEIEERTNEIDHYKRLVYEATEEQKRLLYVGMTRPKELLITTTTTSRGKIQENCWLKNIGVKMPCNTVQQGMEWYGGKFEYTEAKVDPDDVTTTETETIKTFESIKLPAERADYLERNISPSKTAESNRLERVSICGKFADRIQISSADHQDNTIGTFVHHVMCLWPTNEPNKSAIEKMAAEYGVEVDANVLINSIRNFWDWLRKTYGEGGEILCETPFDYLSDNGQCISGEIDLIYRTAEGDVLVDYKTYHGADSLTDPESKFYAGKYSGQIELYEQALRRSGSRVRDRLICYLTLGWLVRFEYK